MEIRVHWEYPDFYTNEYDKTYEDIELDDDSTEEEIEKEAKEVAFEHFDWSWEILRKEKKEKTNQEIVEGWRRVIKKSKTKKQKRRSILADMELNDD